MKNQILNQLDSRIINALSKRIMASTQTQDAFDDFKKVVALSERSGFEANFEAMATHILNLPDVTSNQSNYLEDAIKSSISKSAVKNVFDVALEGAPKEHLSGLHKIVPNFKLPTKMRKSISSRLGKDAGEWPVPLAFQDDNWTPMQNDDILSAIQLILSVEDLPLDMDFAKLITKTTRGRETDLLFYDEARVVELLVCPDGGVARTMVVMLTHDSVLFFDGTSNMIHHYNVNNKLKLTTQKQALQYLKFFCAFVHGEEGAFNVVSKLETAEERFSKHDTISSSVENEFKPTILKKAGTNKKGAVWNVETYVLYSNLFFQAFFSILESGMISMDKDNPLVADLSIKRDKFTLGWRVVLEG